MSQENKERFVAIKPGQVVRVHQKIKEMNAKTIAYYWRSEKLESDRLKQWKKFLNDKFLLFKSGVKASDIFDAGLL